MNLERMENIGRKTVFSTVWQKKENTEEGKPGRKFSLKPTNFIPPNREEKPREKILSQHFYHNTPFWNQVKKKKHRERALEKKKKGENEGAGVK